VALLDPDGVLLALYAAAVPTGGDGDSDGDSDADRDGLVTARAVAVFVG
jgi:hypothetical protein